MAGADTGAPSGLESFAAAEADLAVLDLPRERLVRLFAYHRWIQASAPSIADVHAIVKGAAEGLVDVGVPLARMMTGVEVRHSQRKAVGRIWEPGVPPREVFLPHGGSADALRRGSPFAAAQESGQWIRFDPQRTDPGAYDVVAELRAAGLTDYVCVPVAGFGGTRNGASFATSAPGGFSETDLTVLRFLLPAFGTLMDLLVTRRILNEVTRIYLGAGPAARVLSGDVRRGEVTAIRSAILFSDMRRFTETAMRLSAEQTVDLLNRYYDCVVGPVEAGGGEVLKFIGDGILAIFRIEDGDPEAAVAAALAASRAALDAVAALNASGEAPAPFEIGIVLHLGEAAYGNVGSGERQDYTVIGRDVNLASRIAGLCGLLERPLLLSATLATCVAGDAVAEVGRFPLKGVPGETPVFTTPVHRS